MDMLTPDQDEVLAGSKLRPLKRVEFEQLASLGVFDDEKVELLFGVVVEMSPIDDLHTVSTHFVQKMLWDAIGKRASVLAHGAFPATDDSMPQPDIFVVPTVTWNHRSSFAHLIVEVARSSLAKDRKLKARLYAMADVDEYWIVDHVNGVVHVHREPDRKKRVWKSIATYGRDESIAMLAFPDVVIPVGEILPPVES